MSAVDYSLQIDEARETAICEVRGLSNLSPGISWDLSGATVPENQQQ